MARSVIRTIVTTVATILPTGVTIPPTPIVYQLDPPGEHKVKIELVDANHNVFPGQSVTLDFTVPEHAKKH